MANPICPTDCDAALAVLNFDDCAPAIVASEIKRIFITKSSAAPFTDWKTAAEWTTRLNQSAVTEGSIRTLIVIGDKPAAAGVRPGGSG